MEDFEELACPVPPPITQVSRQLREETLLLFYKTCRLKVQLESQHAFSGENVATTVVPETKAFFSRAQKKYLQSVKRTCIRTNSYIIYPYVEAQWNVGLGANGKHDLCPTSAKPCISIKRSGWAIPKSSQRYGKAFGNEIPVKVNRRECQGAGEGRCGDAWSVV